MVESVPVVGVVCKSLLLFEQLVKTANSNRAELVVVLDLCDVLIKGVLKKQASGSDLREGFAKLKEHVEKANGAAKLCNRTGIKAGVVNLFLAGKICKDIAAVKKNILDLCTANDLVLTNELHVSTYIMLGRMRRKHYTVGMNVSTDKIHAAATHILDRQ